MTDHTEPTNRNRAAWADAALDAFRDVTSCDQEDALGDLLTDLMHWSVQNGFDLSAALKRALGHFEAELVEEGRIPPPPEAGDGRGRFEHAALPLLGTLFHFLSEQAPEAGQ